MWLLRLWFTSTWFDLWLVETCFKSLLIFTSREQILVEWPTLVRVESLSFEADERELLLILAWLDRCTEHLTGVKCIWRKCTKCKRMNFSTCTLNFIDALLFDLVLQVTWFVTWTLWLAWIEIWFVTCWIVKIWFETWSGHDLCQTLDYNTHGTKIWKVVLFIHKY